MCTQIVYIHIGKYDTYQKFYFQEDRKIEWEIPTRCMNLQSKPRLNYQFKILTTFLIQKERYTRNVFSDEFTHANAYLGIHLYQILGILAPDDLAIKCANSTLPSLGTVSIDSILKFL